MLCVIYRSGLFSGNSGPKNVTICSLFHTGECYNVRKTGWNTWECFWLQFTNMGYIFIAFLAIWDIEKGALLCTGERCLEGSLWNGIFSR